ncbi:MAG: hypothetical protein WBA37_19530 [Xanthobacteraceae bacterium]
MSDPDSGKSGKLQRPEKFLKVRKLLDRIQAEDIEIIDNGLTLQQRNPAKPSIPTVPAVAHIDMGALLHTVGKKSGGKLYAGKTE